MAEDSTLYFPLPGSRSTRVLYIEAGAFDDEIRCQIDVIDLDDEQALEYEALSYVWGPAEPRHWLQISGVEKSVTENLATAIRWLRREDAPVLTWIDALCINQDDLDERAQQVRLMRDIYSKAYSTILWLGEEDERTEGAIAILRIASEQAKRDFRWDEDGNAEDIPGLHLGRLAFDPDEYKRIGLPEPDNESWQALFDILQRPWFNRVVRSPGILRQGLIKPLKDPRKSGFRRC